MQDKLRRRASVGHDGLTCPGHAVCDTATRRRPACAASSVRLPVVETPFAAADINSPPHIARTTLSLDGLPELHPAPDWSALRHQPQPGCPRCDARHPGGPVTHLLPHHRYVCTRHRYWIGPPDIDQPATGLAGLDDIVRAQRQHLRLLGRHGPAAGPPRSGCWAATVRLPPTTRC